MKNIIIIILTCTLLFSCNKIDGPFIEINDELEVTVEFPPLDRSSVYRKILFEEYTGHLCVNCPLGHQRLEELMEIYSDTLIPVCIHAGNFARPTNEFPEDFRTTAGTQLAKDFNVQSYPSGMPARFAWDIYWCTPPSNWQNHINNVDRNKVYAVIQVINQYNAVSKKLIANAQVTILEEIIDPVQLCFFLIENGVIAPQLNGNETIQDYEHQHLLRSDLNGVYGKRITFDGIVQKDSVYKKAFPLNFQEKSWITKNCYIVVFLINMATKEVLQVEQAKVED